METILYLILGITLGCVMILVYNIFTPAQDKKQLTPLNSTIDEWKSYTSSARYLPVSTEYGWAIHDKLENKYAPFDTKDSRDLGIKQICENNLNPNWLAWSTAEEFFEALEIKSHE